MRLRIMTILTTMLTCAVSAQDTIHVQAGWNNIGALSTGAFSNVLCTDPPSIITSVFYRFNPGVGYVGTNTLEKGLGYWVKVTSDGIIVFNGLCGGGGGGGSACPGKASVDYEGGPYPTVQIGSQCWLAKNLNIGTIVAGTTIQANNATVEKYCYDDDTANCAIYGGLYQWDEAMQYDTTSGARGICPPGWHIPTLTEIQTLRNAVGSDGNALKAIGQGTDSGAGTNTSGFSALLAGGRWDWTGGGFSSIGGYAYFWNTLTSGMSADAWILYDYDNFIGLNYFTKANGFSVRCLAD